MLLKTLPIFLSLVFVLSNPSPSLIGGEEVELGEIPFIVSIRPWGSNVHLQSGSIISNLWILTSAQYLTNRVGNSLNIVMGIVDLSDVGVSRRSNLIEIHFAFVPSSLLNDIALVRVAQAIDFSPTIQSIFISSMMRRDGFTVGWPTMLPTSQRSATLRKLNAELFSCPQNGQFPIGSAHFCARGVPMGGHCLGSEGAPFFIGNYGRFELIGWLSWFVSPCGVYPDVYLDASLYMIWIRSVTGI